MAVNNDDITRAEEKILRKLKQHKSIVAKYFPDVVHIKDDGEVWPLEMYEQLENWVRAVFKDLKKGGKDV